MTDDDRPDGEGSEQIWVDPHPHETAALLKAERICSALDEVAGATTKAFGPKGGHDAAMRQGYLGVAYQSGRFICRYDPALASPQPWHTAMEARLGPDDASLVDYVPTVRSAVRLAQLLQDVGRCDWHPGAAATSFTAAVDAEREVVEVNLAHDTPPDVVEALRILGGEYVEVTTTGRFMRRSGRRGRPRARASGRTPQSPPA